MIHKPALVDLLARGLSVPRLAAYRLSEEETGATIAGRYLWNARLAEALHPALHFLEVALRNRLDEAIASIAGPGWIEDARVVVDERSRLHVAEVRKRISDDGAQPDRDRIIAGVDFGFWTALFKRQYEVGPGKPANQIFLWPQLIKLVIPNGLPHHRLRSGLDERIGGIRILRNRVYHHEPIWNGRRNRRGTSVPLLTDYRATVELVDAISPELREMLRLVDRFDDVFHGGVARSAEAVARYCADRGYAA